MQEIVWHIIHHHWLVVLYYNTFFKSGSALQCISHFCKHLTSKVIIWLLFLLPCPPYQPKWRSEDGESERTCASKVNPTLLGELDRSWSQSKLKNPMLKIVWKGDVGWVANFRCKWLEERGSWQWWLLSLPGCHAWRHTQGQPSSVLGVHFAQRHFLSLQPSGYLCNSVAVLY